MQHMLQVLDVIIVLLFAANLWVRRIQCRRTVASLHFELSERAGQSDAR